MIKNENTEKPTESTCEQSDKPTVQEIAERYLGQVEWMDDVRGRCTCPGQHKHTSRSHKNDCWIFVNGTPTTTCLHHSCKPEVDAVNSKIRSAWSLFQPELDPALLAVAKAKAAKRHELEEKARASLPEILKQYKWDVSDIEGEGKFCGRINGNSTDVFIERMFAPDDIVWIGEPDSTGRPEHRANFVARKDWNMLHKLYNGSPWHFTCASTFNPGTYSRANVNVKETKYLVVEGDAIGGVIPETDEQKQKNKDLSGAIFNWLRSGCGLRLRAIIDSGGKSLHSWWDRPATQQLEELKIVLPMLGADRAMFKPSQPCRLPGVTRDNGNKQKLLWLD